MHVGEDVDLTWRLRDNGWTISYIPAGNVLHAHRSSVRSFMSRRFDYGTSEGTLQILHPARRKRMVVPPLLAAVLALCLATPFLGLWPLLLAAALLMVDAVAVGRRVRRQGLAIGTIEIMGGRLRAAGSLVYYLSYHLVRYYSVPMIVMSLFIPLVWLAFGFVLVCAAAVDHAVKKARLSLPLFIGIYLLEQLAYGSGVFWGCLERKCFASYKVLIFRHAELPA